MDIKFYIKNINYIRDIRLLDGLPSLYGQRALDLPQLYNDYNYTYRVTHFVRPYN